MATEDQERQVSNDDVPWDDLDPGIYGAVKELRALGMDTFDSGDGRFKASLPGHGEDGPYGYSDTAHVFIKARDLQTEMLTIFEWIESMGRDDICVQGDIYRKPETGEIWFVILVHGDGLFNLDHA